MSEHGQDVRVLAFTGNSGWFSAGDATRITPSPATLTVLREATDGRTLRRVSVLPNAQRPATLGKPGEQVHAVRFVGDRGYLVTFRRTEPLYVLDLAEPADPKTAGELEVPGFSDHLFALDNGLLLGAGHDADANGVQGGLRFTLFDVANPAQPRAVHSELAGQRGSLSSLNCTPHGLALRVDGRQMRLAVPAALAQGNFGDYRTGVLRFQVDTAARSMAAKPWLPVFSAQLHGLWGQRLMHSGEHLLHLSGGELLTHGW